MSSFEWMELQTLTDDIELSRSRLVEARRSGDQGRVGALEEEITRAEKRRLQLLHHISTNIVTIPDAAPAAKAKDSDGSRQAAPPATADLEKKAGAEKPPGAAASAPEPASPAKARGGPASRQPPAPAAKSVPDEAEEEPAPGETAVAPEPAPASKAREGAGARQAAAEPPVETASAPEPAPPPKARDGAGARPAPAEAGPAEAAAEPPPVETASAREPAPPPKARDGVGARPASAPAAEAAQDKAAAEPPPVEIASAPEPAPPSKAREAAGARPASLKADSTQGGTAVWDQLKPSDIERVKAELGTRRTEMLARHAEELKELDAEQGQLETLEQAIDMFLRKANRSQNAAA